MNAARKMPVSGSPSSFVFDSFAILAYLGGEAGCSRVQELLASAEAGKCTIYLSLINLGEVLYITERARNLAQAQRTLAAIDQLPLQIVPVSRTTVIAAAHLKACYPLSYADAFALAAAQEHHCTLVTGDPEFRSPAVQKVVTVEWLPRS